MNGSGKTTALHALETVRSMALGRPPVANAFRNKGGESEIVVHFTDEADISFEYGITFGDTITEEHASFSPNGRTTRIFTRNGDTVTPGQKFQGLKGLDADERTSFLHTACEFGDEVCSRMHDWFSHCMFTVPEFSRQRVADLMKVVSRDIELRADLVRTLRMAGFKIASLDENGITYEYNEDKKDACTVSYTDESMGTLEAILTFYSMYYSLKKGALMLSDCFGAHMQPDLTRFLLKQFRNDSNLSKAQLMAVSYDSSLMSVDLLRRDQIIIASKDDTGASRLHAVSDFKGVRTNTDIAKAYENGRFSGTPGEE